MMVAGRTTASIASPSVGNWEGTKKTSWEVVGINESRSYRGNDQVDVQSAAKVPRAVNGLQCEDEHVCPGLAVGIERTGLRDHRPNGSASWRRTLDETEAHGLENASNHNGRMATKNKLNFKRNRNHVSSRPGSRASGDGSQPEKRHQLMPDDDWPQLPPRPVNQAKYKTDRHDDHGPRRALIGVIQEAQQRADSDAES